MKKLVIIVFVVIILLFGGIITFMQQMEVGPFAKEESVDAVPPSTGPPCSRLKNIYIMLQ